MNKTDIDIESILEEKIDSTITEFSDLSYFFGPQADSIHIDPIQYPDRSVIERCAFIHDFTNKKDLEKVLEMWSRVKGDNLNTGIVLLIFAVFGALFVWMIIAKVRKFRYEMKHKKRRRKKANR